MDTSTVPNSPFTQKRQRRHVVMLAAAVTAILIVIGLIVVYLRSQRTGLLILEPTADLTVKLNGRTTLPQTSSGGLFIPLYAGQYRLELDKPGYQPFIQDIHPVAGTTFEVRPAFALAPAVQQTSGETMDYIRPSADQQSIYYLGNFRQRLYRLDVKSQTVIPLTDVPLSGVEDVEWNNDPDVALIVQNDGVYLHEIPRYDFQHQTYTKVAGTEFTSPRWDPNNPDRLAAGYFPSTGEQSLVITDKTFSSLSRVASLQGIPNPKIIWSSTSNYILLIAQTSDYASQNAWLLTLANGQLQQLTQDGGIQDALFNPDDTNLLLQHIDQQGNRSQELLNLTTLATTTLNETQPLSRIVWQDATHYYELSGDNQTLYLHQLNGGQAGTPVSVPSGSDIQSLFYYSQPQELIVATSMGAYTVNLKSQ